MRRKVNLPCERFRTLKRFGKPTGVAFIGSACDGVSYYGVSDLSGAWRNGSPETPVPQALSGPDRAVSKGAAGVDLIGLGRSGIDCLFARAFAGVGGSTIIDADRFDAGDQAFADRLFVPGIRRVGDIRTAAALIAPGRLTIHNAAKGFPADWIKRAYAAAGLPNSIDVTNGALAPEQMVTRL